MSDRNSHPIHENTLAIPRRWREVVGHAKAEVASWPQWMRDEMRAESRAIALHSGR